MRNCSSFNGQQAAGKQLDFIKGMFQVQNNLSFFDSIRDMLSGATGEKATDDINKSFFFNVLHTIQYLDEKYILNTYYIVYCIFIVFNFTFIFILNFH